MNLLWNIGFWKRCALGAVVGALSLTAGVAQAVGIAGQGTWETTLQPRDLSGDNVVDAFYDTALNITWMRNGNANGDMNWTNASAWAAGLVLGGVGGWRLPTMVDTGAPGCDFSNAGGTDCGYNVLTATNELAHLWYVSLGNKALCTPGDTACATQQPGWGLSNTGYFQGLNSCCYFTGVTFALDVNHVWGMNFGTGAVTTLSKAPNAWAIAVHAGDVAAVPEPQTCALMVMGLGTVLAATRRRRW